MSLLIVGAYRSGTTLVEKLAHMHPDLSIASQPFPDLYAEAKRRFLAAHGWADVYPLGHRFRDDRYQDAELHDSLDAMRFTADDLAALIRSMGGYSGWWTPELGEHLDALDEGTLLEIRARMHDVLARVFQRPDALVVGSKEILVEEYAPYLRARGERVIIVIRDPRGMLASLTSGEGARYGGKRRPTLFHVRTWRKSVAYALALRHDPNVLVLRYEDVVAAPERVLDRIATFAGLDAAPRDVLDGGLVDQRGRPWGGNSSFGRVAGIDERSAQRFRQVLDTTTLRYVEACTLPELFALGYPSTGSDSFDEDAVSDFREPEPVDHPLFVDDGTYDPPRCAPEEIERFRKAGSVLDEEDALSWFIHPEAHRALQVALIQRRSILPAG